MGIHGRNYGQKYETTEWGEEKSGSPTQLLLAVGEPDKGKSSKRHSSLNPLSQSAGIVTKNLDLVMP